MLQELSSNGFLNPFERLNGFWGSISMQNFGDFAGMSGEGLLVFGCHTLRAMRRSLIFARLHYFCNFEMLPNLMGTYKIGE
jgi:hypothetical protein